MSKPFAAAAAALVVFGATLTGCGGDESSPAKATAPAATAATAADEKPDYTVPASGDGPTITVATGQTFTMWLTVSPDQAKTTEAVGWVRDDDAATALITEVSGENVATKDGGVSSRYVFTAAQAGQADMGFRQVTLVNSGAVPLAKTGVVRVTVN